MTAVKRTPKPVAVEEEEKPAEEVVSTPAEVVPDAPADDESPADGEGVEEVKPKRQNFSHMNCSHERTKKARALCRKARAKVEKPSSVPDAEAEEPTEG